MAHQNHWEERGLYRVYTGTTSGKEVFNSNLAIHGDARFVDIDYVINDFTQIEGFDVSEEDIQKIVVVDNVASISNPVLKIAIVATLEPLLVWVERYCKMMQGSPYESKIFATIEDAYQWVLETASS